MPEIIDTTNSLIYFDASNDAELGTEEHKTHLRKKYNLADDLGISTKIKATMEITELKVMDAVSFLLAVRMPLSKVESFKAAKP